jgi:hypothetical protein
MEESQALEILRVLAEGVDPFTGEEFPPSSPYQHPQTVRALFTAIQALEKQQANARRKSHLPTQAGKPWSAEEEQRLVASFEAGHSLEELAMIHQRTQGAIQSRLVKLGKLELPEAG